MSGQGATAHANDGHAFPRCHVDAQHNADSPCTFAAEIPSGHVAASLVSLPVVLEVGIEDHSQVVFAEHGVFGLDELAKELLLEARSGISSRDSSMAARGMYGLS